LGPPKLQGLTAIAVSPFWFGVKHEVTFEKKQAKHICLVTTLQKMVSFSNDIIHI
jgi:hypothetical protein